MKKKGKGFTLTELIAVIIILGLLGLIGIPAYNTIRKNTLQKQYENVVGLIETEAAKYAAKKGVTLTNVQELIDEGLIETDDGNSVIDPRNNESMNCYLVEINNEYGNYVSKLIDVQECDLDEAKLNRSTIGIIITGAETGRSGIRSGEWVNENVALTVDSTNIPASESITNYRWVVGNGKTSTEDVITTNVVTSLVTDVHLEVTTSSNHKYFSNIVLRIDKEAPLIKNVKQSEGNDWDAGRDVFVEATDQSGSGIAGYYIGKDECNSTTVFDEISSVNYEKNIASINIYNPTEYHVCVKDKVGNIRSYDEEIILQVKDTLPPSCVINGENTNWTNRDVTITYGCSDSESGCITENRTNTYDETTKTANLSYTISDNAGNTKTCSKTVNVYVDKDAPTAPTTMNFVYGDWSVYEDNSWTKSNIYAGRTSSSRGPIGSTDIGSGVAKYQISSDGRNWEDFNYDYTKPMYKMSGSGIHTRYFRAVDYAGNASESIIRTARIDQTKPTCGTATNASTIWTKNSRTIRQACTDPSGSGCVKSSYDTEYNSGTTTTGSVTISDKVGNTRSCTYDVYVDKEAPTCGTATNASKTWTKDSRTIKQACTETTGSKCVKSSYNTTYSSGTTTTGSVKISDNVGNERTCTYNVYVDKDAPATPTISNPNGTNWSYSDFALTVSSSDSGSGISYYQYTYASNATSTGTNSSTSWVTYANSAKNQFTTPNFTAERNQTVYIRACDSVGWCSGKASTTIKLDKCSKTTPSYGSWSSCSKACDWGTKSRSVTNTGISGRTCSTSTQTDDCYLKSCAPTVTITGNISNWVCGKCRNDCHTNWSAVDSSGNAIKTVNGKCGNTVGKITYTSNQNTITFSYDIRQGKETWIAGGYWVKFIIEDSSGNEVFSKMLKESYGASWNKGSTHTGSFSHTFSTVGTYYIYIDGNSNNPGFDMNFGTITVSSS